MLCPHCGAALAAGSSYCSRCGLAIPTDPHARHAAIVAANQRGEMTPASYEQAISELVVRDESGFYWLPAPEPGRFLYWDGASWVPYQSSQSEAVGAETATIPTAVEASRQTKRRRWLAWAIAGAIVGVGLIAVVVLMGHGLRADQAMASDGHQATATVVAPAVVARSDLATALSSDSSPESAPAATSTPSPAGPTPTPISQVISFGWNNVSRDGADAFEVIDGVGGVSEQFGAYCLSGAGAGQVVAAFEAPDGGRAGSDAVCDGLPGACRTHRCGLFGQTHHLWPGLSHAPHRAARHAR